MRSISSRVFVLVLVALATRVSSWGIRPLRRVVVQPALAKRVVAAAVFAAAVVLSPMDNNAIALSNDARVGGSSFSAPSSVRYSAPSDQYITPSVQYSTPSYPWSMLSYPYPWSTPAYQYSAQALLLISYLGAIWSYLMFMLGRLIGMIFDVLLREMRRQ